VTSDHLSVKNHTYPS